MLVGFCINYIESFMDKYFPGCCCRCFDFGDDYGNVHLLNVLNGDVRAFIEIDILAKRM